MELTEEKVKEIVKEVFQEFLASDRYIFHKKIQILDGRNIIVGTGTGTQIGTEITQKLAFLGATPVIRQNHIEDAPGVGGSYNQIEVNKIVTAVSLINTILEKFGFIKTA